MKHLHLVLAIILFVQLALASNPIGNCGGARAVPYSLANSGGACNIPPVAGIPVANVDETFFSDGAKCGACYEVTGPKGVTTVQIVDKCDKGTGTGGCSGDVVQFGLDEVPAFSVVANRSDTDYIYDLGFREVACTVNGNVKYTAGGVNEYFFQLKIWNFRVALKEVRVKSNAWGGYNSLTRQGRSGIWQWNKSNNNLKFPLTIYLVGVTNELITATFQSSFPSGEADFGDQFANVASTTDVCPMASSPSSVYSDSVTYGWSTDYSFNKVSINTADTANPYSGSACIHAVLNNEGGLQFTRLGGFNPLYFSYLTFAAKANGNANIKIYAGDDTAYFANQAITSTWTKYNISVATLTNPTNDAKYNLVFMNVNGNTQDIWFDDISWQLNPTSPLDGITPVTTAGYEFVDTTTGIILVDTTGTTGFSFSDDTNSDSNSAPAFIANLFGTAFFASVVVLLGFYF